MAADCTWRTQDEINYVRWLERRGRRDLLKIYRKMCRTKKWTGEGMEVDGNEVMRELDRILGQEPGTALVESPERLARRLSTDWFRDGRLREMIRNREKE